MHSFKTGLLFLSALAFATPACFTIKAGDDDDSSGGSAGKGGNGGTTSTGGTTSSGGSSGNSNGGTTSSGGSSGNSGSSGSGGTGGSTTTQTSCKASDLELAFTCEQGQLSAFADTSCKPYYGCSLASICSDSGLDCTDCQAYIQAYVTADDICFTLDQKSAVEDACVSAYADAKSSGTYAQCK